MENKEIDFTNYPQQPHGGKLVNLVLKGKALEEALQRAVDLPKIMIDMEAVITIEMNEFCLIDFWLNRFQKLYFLYFLFLVSLCWQ